MHSSPSPARPVPPTLPVALAAALACLPGSGCSGDDATADGGDVSAETPDDGAAPLEFGAPCANDGECRSGICVEGLCTRACSYRTDCPGEGWTCAEADDGRILCLTTRYTDGEGRYGDPCFATACDEAAGFRCIRRTEDDPYAYCTHDCTDDRDCPYQMVCRDGDDGRYCRPRTYCEPCLLDDQCGWANDDCIADDSGARFCSQACDPARPTTCPTDSACVETEPGRYQCKPAFGRCVGDGELCHPCREDDDCAAGSTCITDRYTRYSFCGSPCRASDECPIEFYCDADLGQCRPRKGSCLHPSGGGHTCDNCADFTDCYNGWCLDTNGDGRGDACADDCEDDPGVCGPWATCYELRSGTTVVGHGCLPHEGIACWQYVQCMSECPGGEPCSLPYCN
ncbi:MAG: hypothetical protein GYA57_04735 [Myxococcales bacterium]|nr:hypothetical protein [Myxococcales bacterium]